MVRIIKIIFVILVLFNFLNGISFAKESYQFEVLSTTDMHGRFSNKDILTGKYEQNSMARVSTIIKRERKKFGDKVIVIDNGDLLQGTLVSYYSLTQKKDMENPMITAIKDIKYDAWVMGNHEFNYSPAQREPQVNYARKAGISILGANIVLKEDGKNIDDVFVKKGTPYYTPFIVKTIEFDNGLKVKVAVIGLGNANNAKWDIAANYPNMQFNSLDNPNGILENEINKWTKIIKDKNLADIIIVSAHSGKTTDTGVKTTKILKESQVISGAKKSHNIDLVIYGHDHSANIEQIKNADGRKIYLMNGGGVSVTRNIFTVNFDKNNKYLNCTITADAVKLSDVKDDRAIVNKLNHWYDETYKWASKPLGFFDKGWNNYKKEVFGKTNDNLVLSQTKINDLIHKAQIWASWTKSGKEQGALVSVTSSVMEVNPDKTVNFIPKDGKSVSVLELSRIYRYSNNILCMVDMTPQQLYKWMNTVANKLTIDKNGNPVIKENESLHGVDTFYGIDYVFDISKPEGQRVVSAKINGENLLEIKTPIRVVLNTFRTSGSHGFYEATGITESDYIWESTKNLPDDEASIQSILGKYFQYKRTVKPNDKVYRGFDSKWKIITK